MVQALENVTSQLKKKGIKDEDIERKIHTASLLAMVEASYEIVNDECDSTPFYRIKFDPDTHSLDFRLLGGGREVPREGALDINMLDQIIASLLRERMPILFEGITGIGKTFTVEKYAKTLFSEDHYRIIRLNQNMSNALQPYIEGRINKDEGVVRIFLKREELEKIAILFIDEQNRGDPNAIIQLKDSRIILSTGEKGDLGIPIPRYERLEEEEGGKKKGEYAWKLDRENRKNLHVISAQNPPATTDAKYSGARRVDAAIANRDLTINVPNAVASSGATLDLLSQGNSHHRRFMTRYADLMSEYLGLERKGLEDTFENDWMFMYAFTADSKKTEHPKMRSAVELKDVLILFANPDLVKIYEEDRRISKDWTEVMKGYAVDFEYPSTLDSGSSALKIIRDIVQTFQEQLVRRDVTKVEKLADAISTVRRLKTARGTKDPVATYDEMLTKANYITVEDIAAAFAIMLKDKQEKKDVETTNLVDMVMKEYVNIAEGFAKEIGYKEAFSTNDTAMSIYNLAFQHAMQESLGKKKGVEAFIKDLGACVAKLKRLEAGQEGRKPLVARFIADLSTLAGFAYQYRESVEDIFTKYLTKPERIAAFKEFYREIRPRMETPDIYRQTLPKVLGV